MSVQSKRHGKDYIRLYNIINYIKDYAVYLGNISKDFTVNNMKKKTGLKGSVNFFLLILDLLILMIF